MMVVLEMGGAALAAHIDQRQLRQTNTRHLVRPFSFGSVQLSSFPHPPRCPLLSPSSQESDKEQSSINQKKSSSRRIFHVNITGSASTPP